MIPAVWLNQAIVFCILLSKTRQQVIITLSITRAEFALWLAVDINLTCAEIRAERTPADAAQFWSIDSLTCIALSWFQARFLAKASFG